MQMLCNTHTGKKSGCFYGNDCCPSILHAAGHKKKRRNIKRRERQQWKRDIRNDT